MKDAIPTPTPAVSRTFDIGRLRLPALVLLSFAYVFGSHWLFMCRYGVNDNGGVLEYAQLGLPSAAMGIPLVKLLHLGYRLLPTLPWYGLCYSLFHMLSVFVWLWSFSRVFRPWWLAAGFSVVFLGYYLPFILYLDYTDTAMMLCAASLTWIILDVMEERPGYLRFLGAGVMFALGEMARPEVPLGSLAYAFPLALLALLWRSRRRPFARTIPAVALITAIFFAPLVVNLAGVAAYRQYAETPQQQQYDRFDAAREELEKHTTRGTKQAIMRDAPLLASMGWTRIDAVHIFNWNYLDERKDTVEALQTLLSKAPPQDISVGYFIGDMESWFHITPFTLLLLGAALISLLAIWRQGWLGVVALCSPLYCIAFSTFMSLYFLYSDRTELPLILGCGFMNLVICYRVTAAEGGRPDRISSSVAGVCILLAGYGAYSILSTEAANRSNVLEWSKDAQERLDILNQDYAGQIILMYPNGAMPIFKLDPLKNHPVDFQPIDLGWSTFSPLFYQQIGKLGAQHGYELMDALITHHGYALGTPGWCQNLQDYISPGLKTHLEVKEVRELPGDFILYQFGESATAK